MSNDDSGDDDMNEKMWMIMRILRALKMMKMRKTNMVMILTRADCKEEMVTVTHWLHVHKFSS